jgi:hypothetical protein
MGKTISPFDLADYVVSWLWKDLQELIQERFEAVLDPFLEACGGSLKSAAPTNVGYQFVKFDKGWLSSRLLSIVEKDKFLKHFYEREVSSFQEYQGLDYLVDRILTGRKKDIGEFIQKSPGWKAREKEIKKLLRDNKKIQEVMNT